MSNKKACKEIWLLSPNQPISSCKEYKYLGITLQGNGSFGEHLELAIKKATHKQSQTLTWLINTNPERYNLTPEIKIRMLYEATIRPTTEYGAQILGATSQSDKIEHLQTKHLRKSLLNDRKGIRNLPTPPPAALRHLTGIPPVQMRRTLLQLSLFNKLRNMGQTTLAGKVFQYRWQKFIKNPNPPTSFSKSCRDAMKELNLPTPDNMDMHIDQKIWKGLLNKTLKGSAAKSDQTNSNKTPTSEYYTQ